MYRKDLKQPGGNPLLLEAYGAYDEILYEPAFCETSLSLMDRGFVCAMAHVRGGGEKDSEWYHDGKLLNKRNTFTDFIASAEHLVKSGIADPGKVAVSGMSAGGLLMTVSTNMRPDLFKAVVAEVPFVDALTTMQDPSIPLTIAEYFEWGNPADKAVYDYIKTYSPYDNLESKEYPAMLITAGLNDYRVQYWEPAKYVARLRTLKTDDNPLLLRTNMSAGHSGASGRYEELRDTAFKYAFILKALGLDSEG
jgi:oligopeptidase B